MPHIELNEHVASSFYQASPAAWQLANDIAKARSPYEALTLDVDLARLRLPDVGTVQVPVNLALGHAAGIPPSEFAITLSARKSGAMFPHFSGRLQIHEEGGTRSRIILDGEYSVPLGGLGKAMNDLMLKGVAQESLVSFLHWFASETERRIAHGDYRTAAELMRDTDG